MTDLPQSESYPTFTHAFCFRCGRPILGADQALNIRFCCSPVGVDEQGITMMRDTGTHLCCKECAVEASVLFSRLFREVADWWAEGFSPDFKEQT